MSPPLNRILCVDDEEDILQVAKLALEAVGGFEVATCNGSGDAPECVRTVRPDLVLLDVMMPLQDGPATLRILRASGDQAVASVPVAFMTAKAQPAELQELLDLGAIGVIPKPFDPMILADQVRELWKKHHDANA